MFLALPVPFMVLLFRDGGCEDLTDVACDRKISPVRAPPVMMLGQVERAQEHTSYWPQAIVRIKDFKHHHHPILVLRTEH